MSTVNGDLEDAAFLSGERRVEAEKREVPLVGCDGHQAGQPVRREFAAQISELGDVGVARTRVWITRMRVPFAEMKSAMPTINPWRRPVGPLLEARTAIERQIGKLDRKIMKLVRRDAQVPQFMTVPGVGEAVT